jgi:hypothetical protein
MHGLLLDYTSVEAVAVPETFITEALSGYQVRQASVKGVPLCP